MRDRPGTKSLLLDMLSLRCPQTGMGNDPVGTSSRF